MRTLIFILCSLSLLMMTAGKCKRTRTTSPTYFTVKFNSNGGSVVDSVRLTSGSKVTKPADPTRTSYTFGGWYSDAGLTKAFDFNTPITKDITLYAKWNANAGKISYNVTFNSNGGSAIVMQQVIAGEKAMKPIEPTRDKYTFAGWYSDAGLTQTFDFNTPITKDITLYAKWNANAEKISYNVTFNSNGGSAIVMQQVIAGEKATKPIEPTRDKYTFAGWYSDEALAQTFDFNTPITKAITLYAKWTLTPVVTQLSTIITNGTIPNDLSGYDMVSQQVLSPYVAGAKLSVIYITVNGAGKQDGTSWANAYAGDKLKTAIDNIQDASSNKVYFVLIGAGTYIPGASIAMKNNVGIIGGFPATGGWARSATDTTTISGDNKYSVIYNYGGGIGNSALLYGVKIIGSDASGMKNLGASPTITNVVFSDNAGAGIHIDQGSPILTNIVLRDNTNGNGGGILIFQANPILTNVVFLNNTSRAGGGGLYIYDGSPVLINTLFINNTALSTSSGGGAMVNENASPILINVAFINNKATNATGGGIYNDDGSASPVVVNAIFWGNTSNGTDPQYNLQGSVNYSVVQDSSRATLSPTNPMLSELTYTAGYFMPTVSYAGASPDNLGVYVKRTKTAPYTFYYSTDGSTWYTNPTKIGMGTATNVPADAIDLTATDIQGRPRKGRPNAGVWAK